MRYRPRAKIKGDQRRGDKGGAGVAEPFAVDLHAVIVVQAVYHRGVGESGCQRAETGLAEDGAVTVSAEQPGGADNRFADAVAAGGPTAGEGIQQMQPNLAADGGRNSWRR
ncbi:hypothetical protein GCM10022405_20330 [Gibbsiella dentisursi]|uniref:Uncharacterized protein n=1 Tax=Gibbsiella dentisursi TaxID=796890 RepID=A0ABP7L7W2_9GAMM